MKKFTYADGLAIMILAADKLGLQPQLVHDARRQLEGAAIHPMTGAAIEKEAVEINNRLAHDVSLIAKANVEAEQLKVEFGFVERQEPLLMEFDVEFEAVGFTSSDLSDCELTESEAIGFTEVAGKENTLPADVVAVIRGHISEDDGQDDDDQRKVFVNVTLRIRAKDEQSAEAFSPPRALLASLADMMATDDAGSVDLELEENWEVMAVDLAAAECARRVSEPSLAAVAA
ncbi:hypothetical protein [Duganella vulcania]|uniref:hypothetical protein n=1 Tax=Duganella vulcania TaxID=2692166 RepID=UPI001581BFE2|nr:hypothetical protein [Duganella vulcania]